MNKAQRAEYMKKYRQRKKVEKILKKAPAVTNDNYFDNDIEMFYMGSTQFKNFMKCEAAALAELKGEYIKPKTTSLLVGSYVDAHFDKSLDKFKATHPEIFTQKGELKSEYKKANYIIERIERDELFMQYMSGEKQVVKTGVIAGIPFKVKIDSYFPDMALVDLKVMRDFEPIFVKEQGKLPFILAWQYDLQAAIYQEIAGDKLPFYIAAVTKEDEPNIGIFEIDQMYMDIQIETVKELAPRFAAIKRGEIEPERCENCDYCKKTKKLTEVIRLSDIQWEDD